MKNNEKLVEENRLLKEELQQRVDDNASIYAKLCNVLVQLDEANEMIKWFSLIFPEQKDIVKYFKKYGISEKNT